MKKCVCRICMKRALYNKIGNSETLLFFMPIYYKIFHSFRFIILHFKINRIKLKKNENFKTETRAYLWLEIHVHLP